MRWPSVRWQGPAAWVAAWLLLLVLPLLPEVSLQTQGRSDLKAVVPIFYYQGIVSFLLLAPALLLPRQAGRIWTTGIAVLMAVPTLILGFYSASSGARWNLAAHTAMFQTDAGEAGGFLRGVASVGTVLWIALLATGFVASAVVLLRAQPPARRVALALLLAGLGVSAYGLRNVVRYGHDPIRDVPVAGAAPIRVFGFGINMLHPVTLLAATHFNFRETHRYYLEQYRRAGELSARLHGATPVSATPPRLLVVVLGESATRRHHSLHGYARRTTPRLEALGGELQVFRDVVATTVGSLGSIRAMLTLPEDAVPIFGFFSGAGYTTHWISAKHDQGFEDLELPAFASAANRSVFLGGTYDGNLVPLVAQAAARPGPQAIFVHLMGSHVRYRDRYPAEYAVFRGGDAAAQMQAEYDNSIRYTDAVLADLVELVRRQRSPAALLYLSDHGEDVYDTNPTQYLFRSDAVATDPMYEIPFWVWLSPEYIAGNPDFAAGLRAATGRPYQAQALHHSLLGLARLTHPLYDASRDVFSPAFQPRERRVGHAGRVYESADSLPANR